MAFSCTFQRNLLIPKLAWCAEMMLGRVRVEHGGAVEVGDGSIVEGAWSGRFADWDFSTAPTFTGTGLKVSGDQVLFATPTDTLHALFFIRCRRRLFCSNSLPFLLTRSGDEVDPSYPYYQFDLMSVMYGLNRYCRSIPTLGGHHVSIVYHSNILVDGALRTTSIPKSAPPAFPDYDAYTHFLTSEVVGVSANAGDPERRSGYEPLATISSGYDSPACAILARSAGCREAVTFTKARRDYGYQEDTGKRIAEQLGLEVTEYDSAAYLSQSTLREIEFVASGVGGDDVIFSALEDRLSGRLLYTGFHGDKVWARTGQTPSEDIVRGDASGASMTEFRLRVGFLNLAIPFIGCVRHPSIHSISSSDEMRPWSLDGDYDRPIPRRLVEEAGVPREWFGQTKKAAAMPVVTAHDVDPELGEVLSPRGLESFAHFAARRPLFRSWRDRARYHGVRALHRLNLRMASSPGVWRLSHWLSRTKVFDRHVKERKRHIYLFAWAMAHMRQRYEENGARETSGR